MKITRERKVVWGLMLVLIVAVFAYRLFEPGVRNGMSEHQANTLLARAIGESEPGVDVSGMAGKIPVEAAGVGIHPGTGAAAVFLVTEEGEAYMPVFIGAFEADAISRGLEGVRTPRPLTHELLSEVIDALGGEMVEVVVSSIENGTFRADLALKTLDGESISIDARPSDSIAVALMKGVDIFVSASVMEQAGYEIEDENDIPETVPEPDTPPLPEVPDAELI